MACSSKDKESIHAYRSMPANATISSPSDRGQAGTNDTQPRMVIKKGSLSLRVTDYQPSFELVKAIVMRGQGFIVSMQVEQSANNAKAATIIIKVPSSLFDTTMSQLKAIAERIENEALSGNDVTEQYYDLQARLVNKRKVEQRFQEILKTAKTTKDILEVEQALGEIRVEIERLEGRSRFLSDQVDLSTIDLIMRETDYEFSYTNETFFSKISGGIRTGLDGFGDVLGVLIILLISTIPIWILLALLLFVGVKLFKRYKSKKK